MLKLRLIARFYREIFPAGFLITLSCVYILNLYGTAAAKIIGILFWFKLATIVIIWLTAAFYKKNELYYYQNLGVSKLMLCLSVCGSELFLWLLIMVIQLTGKIPGHLPALVLAAMPVTRF